ncbi:hypothetical protein HHI36_014629 [Cryptolaemus montrouzieri]|uniref:Uncharacterized protein n=1 Tax=Cryptolaemus montrouzieri TaxID=559131 RepID=A0ABD2N3C4_9CUCU
MLRKTFSIYFVISILVVFGTIGAAQQLERSRKVNNSNKLFFDSQEIMDTIIAFCLCLAEIGTSLADIATTMGRKKRSLSEDILFLSQVKETNYWTPKF